MHLLADWHLNVRLGRGADAFACGMGAIIPPGAIRLFSPRELNELVSGGGDDGMKGACVLLAKGPYATAPDDEDLSFGFRP